MSDQFVQDRKIIVKNTKEIINFFKNKNILITGANGFLGKYFIQVFDEYNNYLDKPINVIGLDKTFLKNSYFKNKNLSFIKKDVSKKILINKKIDIIIHAAGIASPFYYRKEPLKTLDVTISGTRNLLDIAKINKSKFIFFSSSEIYGDPDNKNVPTKEDYRGNVNSMGPRACYDESKRLGETLCYIYSNYFNVHTNIIRPFNIYGPGMGQNDYRIFPNFVSNILQNKPISIYGSGNQTRTYCYITDAMDGFLRVIKFGKFGQAYNIGNNKPEVSVEDIYRVFKKINDKKVIAKYVKHPKSYPMDEPQRRCPDIAKSKRHLGYKPKIGLETGLNKYMDWAKKNYKF